MRWLLILHLCVFASAPGLAQYDFTIPPWMEEALGAERVRKASFQGSEHAPGAWPKGRPHPLKFTGSYTYEISAADSLKPLFRIIGWQDARSAVITVEGPYAGMRTTYLVDMEADVAIYARGLNGVKNATVKRASQSLTSWHEVHTHIDRNRYTRTTATGVHDTLLGHDCVELTRHFESTPEGTKVNVWVDTTFLSPFAGIERWLPIQDQAFMAIVPLSLISDQLLFRFRNETTSIELTQLHIGPCARPLVDLTTYDLPRSYLEDAGAIETEGEDVMLVPMEENVAAPIERESVQMPDEESIQEDWVTHAQQMPHFPGGEAAFPSYLAKNLRYPETEKENGIEGTVYLSMIVEPNGAVTNVTPIREVPGAPGLTKEAIRLLRAMPPWVPGRSNGPVRVKMIVPVKFTLE